MNSDLFVMVSMTFSLHEPALKGYENSSSLLSLAVLVERYDGPKNDGTLQTQKGEASQGEIGEIVHGTSHNCGSIVTKVWSLKVSHCFFLVWFVPSSQMFISLKIKII